MIQPILIWWSLIIIIISAFRVVIIYQTTLRITSADGLRFNESSSQGRSLVSIARDPIEVNGETSQVFEDYPIAIFL